MGLAAVVDDVFHRDQQAEADEGAGRQDRQQVAAVVGT
jgi:hypothetical protein